MSIQRFTDQDSTRIWELLNRLAKDAEDLVASTVEDTGWLEVTAWGPNFVAVANFPLQFRKIGKLAQIRGFANRVSGSWAVGSLRITTLPVEVRPTRTTFLNSASRNTGTGVAALRILSSGDVGIEPDYSTGQVSGVIPVSGTWMVD